MSTNESLQCETVCCCCGGDIPPYAVWEARRDDAGECDGSIDIDTGRCRAWVSDDLWEQ